MLLKYAEDVCDIDNCPDATATEVEMTAYRFVFEGADEKSFLPAAKVSPKRQLSESQKCVGEAALSMFCSEDQAKVMYQEYCSRYRNFTKINGDHLATIELKKSLGVATKPNNDGHFSYFEYDTANLKSNVTSEVKLEIN